MPIFVIDWYTEKSFNFKIAKFHNALKHANDTKVGNLFDNYCQSSDKFKL